MPIEVREAKDIEFENLRQKDMTVQDYYLKFVSLSRHAPHMVPDMRAVVRRFVLKLKPKLYRDANTVSQNDKMTISKILAIVQEKALQKQKDREFSKRAKSAGNFSHGGSQGDDNRQFFKNRSSRPAPSIASAPFQRSKFNQKGRNFGMAGSHSQASVTNRGFQHPTCNNCGKRHSRVCRSGMDSCFGCGQSGHFLLDCPSA
ncbi:uncharacterized protein LOC132619830 [Lycium barbarum]|uniref:uncharacterized protein LOC132619830 n=1 Tax=Lycium barbarum TaxID=112863 RepID=UPI00293E5E8E|nr:uncharacterized protein LOC132619830 [Lycium barbarum]